MTDPLVNFENKTQNNSFAIAFSTKAIAGWVKYTKITIEADVLGMADQEKVDVSLAEHPLYPILCAYVKANPPRN
jgi:hypothetical protein